MKKLLLIPLAALLFAGIAMSANDCSKITLDSTFTTKTKADKQTTLQNKIWQDVKRNQIPEMDISLVSVEEMTQAYVDLTNNKHAHTDNNLFKGLRQEVVREGITCP